MRNSLFILASLTDADVDVLLAEGRRERMAPGERLTTQGVRVEFLDLILDGAFEVRVGANEGQAVGRRHRGDMIGEISFLDRRPASASVVAIEPSRVLRIPKERLEARLAADEGFTARFFRALGTMLAYRLRDLTEKQAPGSSGDEDVLELDMLDGVDVAARRFDQHLARLLD